MKKLLLLSVTVATAAFSAHSQSYFPVKGKSKMVVKESVPVTAYSFPLERVQLREGPFQKAREADTKWLATIEPDRLLADFRKHAGLQPKGERYGGWESSGLAGHSLGHYLSAISMEYAVSKDSRFLDKVNYIVDELAECQPKRNGYLGAIPKEDSMWAEVKKGNIRSRGFDLNGAWSPWYTVHKIMAGLLDAYVYCNNSKALAMQEKFSVWTEELLAGLPDSLNQKMLLCEYGGMNETLVNTYALTNNKRYLDLSYKFHDRKILDSLAMQHDILPGKHSNTQIPKVIGCIRRYQLTGSNQDRSTATFFWNTVVNQHTYAPGGNSNYEYFGAAAKLSETLTDNTMETCNTYNMLKLTKHLYALDPRASYFDFYERALYNHILASQNDGDGMMCYFVPLRMGGKKRFSNPYNTFTCCVGSGMENHVKYGEGIYATDRDGNLYVNLFIASELDFSEQGAKVEMETKLPQNNHVGLKLSMKKAKTYTIRIRRPHWAGRELALSVNGETIPAVTDEQGYISLKRKWKDGDRIALTLPMDLYSAPMPDNPARQAFFYGPITLAGVLGNKEPEPVSGIPVIVSDNVKPSAWLNKSGVDSLVFTSLKAGVPAQVVFRPFHEIDDDYYSVYFDVFTPDAWKAEQVKYEAVRREQRRIDSLTVDNLRVGEMQPERDHEFSGDETFTGESHGRKWRSTRNGGAMRFEMGTRADAEHALMLTYWGMDNRGRIFDIYVEDVLVATEDLNKYKGSHFYDISYPIPSTITKGKQKVTVQLKPKPNNSVGPVYGNIRMMLLP